MLGMSISLHDIDNRIVIVYFIYRPKKKYTYHVPQPGTFHILMGIGDGKDYIRLMVLKKG